MKASSAVKRPQSAHCPLLFRQPNVYRRGQSLRRLLESCASPMIKLNLDVKRDGALKVLCLGSHSDDIEIGCGGTILRLLRSNPNLEVAWVVFSSIEEREREARKSAELFLAEAKRKDVIVNDFRD